MAAGSAEDVGKDRLLVRFVFLVHAGLKGNEAILVLIEGRVDRAGLGDELMQLEGKQRVALSGLLQPDIGDTDPLQQFLEKGPAGFCWHTGVGSQFLGNLDQLFRFAPNENAFADIKGNLVLQPDGDRMSLQLFDAVILIDAVC